MTAAAFSAQTSPPSPGNWGNTTMNRRAPFDALGWSGPCAFAAARMPDFAAHSPRPSRKQSTGRGTEHDARDIGGIRLRLDAQQRRNLQCGHVLPFAVGPGGGKRTREIELDLVACLELLPFGSELLPKAEEHAFLR